MTVRHSRVAGSQVVTVDGEVDLATVPRLHDALAQAIDSNDYGTGNGPLLVDIDAVTVIDDSGSPIRDKADRLIGVLLGAAASARRAGRELIIVCSAPRLLERLHETRLHRAIEVRPRVTAQP